MKDKNSFCSPHFSLFSRLLENRTVSVSGRDTAGIQVRTTVAAEGWDIVMVAPCPNTRKSSENMPENTEIFCLEKLKFLKLKTPGLVYLSCVFSNTRQYLNFTLKSLPAPPGIRI